MNKVKKIKGLKDIIDKYDVFLLDQWGVIHDGNKGFLSAINCINKLHEHEKYIILISNSSKRKTKTIKRLPELGFDSSLFIEVMTSGEMIWQSLKNKNHVFTKNIKKNCYYLCDKNKKEKNDYIKGLTNYNFVNKLEDADFILATTTSPGLKTLDYIPLLKKALKKNLPFICANPDYESIETKSKKFKICMGSIAELYRALGGKIFILGKPKTEIYIESTLKIKNFNKSKVLAVGDSIYHDIKGANNFGIDSLLITSGIHHVDFDIKNPIWTSNKNTLRNLAIRPTFMCSKFQI